MATRPERQDNPRFTVPPEFSGPRREQMRLVNLSREGACIEHFRALLDWDICFVHLPLALEGIRLQGEVRWSRVIGRQPGTEGGQQLIYQSGLRFILLTPEQQTGLMTALKLLRSALEASAPPHHQS